MKKKGVLGIVTNNDFKEWNESATNFRSAKNGRQLPVRDPSPGTQNVRAERIGVTASRCIPASGGMRGKLGMTHSPNVQRFNVYEGNLAMSPIKRQFSGRNSEDLGN